MPDEKQMNSIRNFCSKNISQHGKQRTSSGGLYDHDWADLVNQVHYFDSGKSLQDVAILKVVAKTVRREFPNNPDWNKNVNAPGAHTKILGIIREGLQAQLHPPVIPPQTSEVS